MFNNSPEHLIGQQFGNYKLTKFLNGGGFGFVYQAEHIKLPKTVAIKLLKPDFVHEKEYMEAFEREAKLVASLKHDNILDILDYDNFKGVPYIIMPFYPTRKFAYRTS